LRHDAGATARRDHATSVDGMPGVAGALWERRACRITTVAAAISAAPAAVIRATCIAPTKAVFARAAIGAPRREATAHDALVWAATLLGRPARLTWLL